MTELRQTEMEQAALRRVATASAEGDRAESGLRARSRQEGGAPRAATRRRQTRFDDRDWNRGTSRRSTGSAPARRTLRVGRRLRRASRTRDAGDRRGSTRTILRRQTCLRPCDAEGIRSGLAATDCRERELWARSPCVIRSALPVRYTARRLADFTELIATAIANADAREAAGTPRRRAGSAPARRDAGRAGCPAGRALRGGHQGGRARVLGRGAPARSDRHQVRSRPRNASSSVRRGRTSANRSDRAGRPRISTSRRECCAPDALPAWTKRTWNPSAGPTPKSSVSVGFLCQVGSPVVVEGRLWGAMTLNSNEAATARYRRSAWRASPSSSQPRSPTPSRARRSRGSRRSRRRCGASRRSSPVTPRPPRSSRP